MLRWMCSPNKARGFSCRGDLPLNSSLLFLCFGFTSISKWFESRSPRGGSRGWTVDEGSQSRRSRFFSWSFFFIFTTCRLILFFKDAFSHLLQACNLKSRSCARHGFIERDFTSLDDEVSLKIKHSVSTTVGGIAKKNAIRGARFKFVQFALLKNEALAAKDSEMAYFWSLAHHQLIRGFLEKSTQENAICHIARGIYRLGPISPRSPMLIKHRPSHLHKGPIFSFPQLHSKEEHREKRIGVQDQDHCKSCQSGHFLILCHCHCESQIGRAHV